MDRKYLITISWNKGHIAQQTFHSQLVKALQGEHSAEQPFELRGEQELISFPYVNPSFILFTYVL